ncbi:MAG TPA: response regulator [Gemmatimonadales bacterium]|nr:response regulator [Gemmatimonadales bacterium]
MIAAAAALAPHRALQLERDRATPTSGLTARVVALIVGLAGMSGMAIVGIVRPEPGVDVAILNFLKRRGMHAVAVGDGADALRALRREHFDVIVSDVRMPGMSGGEFLERLRRDYPAMVNRLVFTTGDTFAADTSELLRDSGLPSLVKPYDFAQLEDLLREVAKTSA